MRYFILLFAGVFIAGPACAQDFSGLRIEGRGGWDVTKASSSLPNPDEDEDEDGDEFLIATARDDGPDYGAEVGYDIQLGSAVVLGAYAGGDFANRWSCVELVEDDQACARSRRSFTLGARAGVALGETVLLYAKGGYSNGKVEVSYDPDLTDNASDDPGGVVYHDAKIDGFHLGAGLELAVSGALYAKAEYVYTDYGTGRYAIDDADGSPELAIGLRRHQALVGVGVRF